MSNSKGGGEGKKEHKLLVESLIREFNKLVQSCTEFDTELRFRIEIRYMDRSLWASESRGTG